MKILHIAAECYPAAKAGGLGDVVGALPKYLNQKGVQTAVIIPKYKTKWLLGQRFKKEIDGTVRIGSYQAPYSVYLCENVSLGFPLYVVDAPQFFDRPGIYTDANGQGYEDEVERNLVFQQAVLHWILGMKERPHLLHCHDHHTALVPFIVKHCPEYNALKNIPTVFTIHNGQYQGAFSWQKAQSLPFFEAKAASLLEWNNVINPMACALKCCWYFTTVSPGYLSELRQYSGGLEWLMNNERAKSIGILNGIDTQVWNPFTDPMIEYRLTNDVNVYKRENKRAVCRRFRIREDLPLFTFIGRLVGEKGADLLPPLIGSFLYEGAQACFVVLGTGDPSISDALKKMQSHFFGYFDTSLEYNETLAHQLYAGADFLLMPSRVEPCGLNQMYAQRYGTVPVVRSVGGLRDTVTDVASPSGSGIRFDRFTVEDAKLALYRSVKLYHDSLSLKSLREKIIGMDHSWEKSVHQYIQIYDALT